MMIMPMTSQKACELSYEEVAMCLKVDVRKGLSWEEADRRRGVHGFNEFEVKQDDPLWKKYFEQVNSC